EALDRVGCGRGRIEQLERHDLADLSIAHAKHGTHAAATEQLLDLVAAREQLADGDARAYGDRGVVALGVGHGSTLAEVPQSLTLRAAPHTCFASLGGPESPSGARRAVPTTTCRRPGLR